jgi:hypothetical protein
MTQSRKKWKLATSCITGDAASCRSICHGVGWPSPAHAAPALASKIPKISAVALNHDNPGITLGSDLPRSRPVLAVPAPRSQDMRTKYMFIVQRHVIVQPYGLMPRPLPAGFCTAARRRFRPR